MARETMTQMMSRLSKMDDAHVMQIWEAIVWCSNHPVEDLIEDKGEAKDWIDAVYSEMSNRTLFKNDFKYPVVEDPKDLRINELEVRVKHLEKRLLELETMGGTFPV